MGLEIQDDWTFPLSTGAKCLEKGGLGENCNSLNSLRHPSPGCTVHWLLIRELYSYNRHHCPDVDAPQCFPSRKQRLLGSGKFPDFTPLMRGPYFAPTWVFFTRRRALSSCLFTTSISSQRPPKGSSLCSSHGAFPAGMEDRLYDLKHNPPLTQFNACT